MKKRGITFAELEMPVTAHLKVCSLVRIFHGFQQLLDVRNPPHLTYQQILFSPLFRNEECSILLQCHCYPAPEETKRQKKPIEDHEDSDDIEECDEDSQLAGSSSQDWLANHASIVNEKMCPSVSYWIALTTPNGAPTSPLAIHRALLECGVDVFTNQVRKRT